MQFRLHEKRSHRGHLYFEVVESQLAQGSTFGLFGALEQKFSASSFMTSSASTTVTCPAQNGIDIILDDFAFLTGVVLTDPFSH